MARCGKRVCCALLLKSGDDGPEMEAKAMGYIFCNPRDCVEISASEFTRLIHEALDISLLPSEKQL